MQLVEHTLSTSTETPRTITRLTNEQCKKMEDNRAKKKLYYSSFQNVEKNRERSRSIRRNNPEYVFNNLEKVRENLKNKETKEKNLQNVKRRLEDPTTKEKNLQNVKRSLEDPTTREKNLQNVKNRLVDPTIKNTNLDRARSRKKNI